MSAIGRAVWLGVLGIEKEEMIKNDRVILRWIFLLKPSDIKCRFSLEEFGNRATYNITMIQTFDLFRSCES